MPEKEPPEPREHRVWDRRTAIVAAGAAVVLVSWAAIGAVLLFSAGSVDSQAEPSDSTPSPTSVHSEAIKPVAATERAKPIKYAPKKYKGPLPTMTTGRPAPSGKASPDAEEPDQPEGETSHHWPGNNGGHDHHDHQDHDGHHDHHDGDHDGGGHR